MRAFDSRDTRRGKESTVSDEQIPDSQDVRRDERTVVSQSKK